MSPLFHGAIRGAVLGLGWGLAARIWMRAISTDPEFSWSGTLIILAFATWLGVASGILAAARATGRRPWWALLGAPAIVLFAGPGLLFLPAFAGGGLALSGRAPAWRGVGWAAAATPVALVALASLQEPSADDGLLLFALAGSAMLSLGLAALGAPLWATNAGPVAVSPSGEQRSAASTRETRPVPEASSTPATVS